MNYKHLNQILLEAESRIKNSSDENIVRRSTETVEIVNERLLLDGLSRTGLAELAKTYRHNQTGEDK